MSSTQAVIVGAGPAGMTTAIELRRAGLEVRIIDRLTHMARWSQALVLQARTLEQLERYGIAQTALDRGRKLTAARLFSGPKEIAHFGFDTVQGHYPFVLFLPQSETEQILDDHMKSLGVTTERGVELLSFERHQNGVLAHVRHPDGRKEDIEANWLIGCDGAHSTVRKRCHIDFEGKGIPMSFYLADLKLEGQDKPVAELCVHLHDRGEVLFIAPLSDELTRVIVATPGQRDAEAHKEEVSIADFERAFAAAAVDVRIREAHWMSPFHVSDRQAARYRLGRVFLAGDAAHIHSPIGGQGMNTGMQDAANLAWKIAAVERGSTTPDKLLDSYGEERGEVGHALVNITERVLSMVTMRNSLAVKLRDLLAPHVSHVLQRSAAQFVSETGIAYRSSHVVSDQGGDGTLRAGDRFPAIEEAPRWATISRPSHLAIALDASETQLERLRRTLKRVEIMDLRSSSLSETERAELGVATKLFVLRPDGYVGWRGPLDASNALATYAQQDALG